MEPLDFAVYRFLSQEGVARFWAGRRVLDPRITPREIAGRVGLSESGVRTRLHHLAERGFLRDRAVVPHPALFGRKVFVADLVVHQPGEVDRILRDLGLVEGVMFTRDVMDETERTVQVYFGCEDEARAPRIAALIGRLATASGPVVPRLYYLPPCALEMSRVDWRVLNGVLREPDASFAELGKAVGISLKTAARSYHRLVEGRACWWTHGPQSEEFPLALVRVDLDDPKDRESVAGWIGFDGHPWMPVANDGLGLEPEDAEGVVAGLVPDDLPTALERFLRNLAGVAGVARIRRTFALGSASYTAWFADRLAGQALRGS